MAFLLQTRKTAEIGHRNDSSVEKTCRELTVMSHFCDQFQLFEGEGEKPPFEGEKPPIVISMYCLGIT